MLRYSDARTQEVWRAGITAAEKSGKNPEVVIEELAVNETEGFFPVLKRMTIEAYDWYCGHWERHPPQPNPVLRLLDALS